jgi:hypothetical protein
MIHPYIAIDFAMYCSVGFGIAVIGWACRFLSGDDTLLSEFQGNIDRSTGSKSMLTYTRIFSNEADSTLHQMHRQLVVQQSDRNKSVMISHQSKKRKTCDEAIGVHWKFMDSIASADFTWNNLKLVDTSPSKYVYFIRMRNTSYIKIGFSTCVNARMNVLNVGNPIQLDLEFKFKTDKFRLHESLLHIHFTKYHVRGEWFIIKDNIDFSEVVDKVCY